MQSRTASFFDVYANDFSAIYGNEHTPLNAVVNRLFRKSMMTRYEKSLAGCTPIEGKSVIDIGCGPGHYSVALAVRGASRVLGVDFAPGMIDLAQERARAAGVDERCSFLLGDFLELAGDEKFDYAIVTGFMDYIEDPLSLMQKVLSVCKGKAFLSFPADGGLLAWQRRLRYRSRCDLYLYGEAQIRSLLSRLDVKGSTVERISRDFFVTIKA